MAKLVENQTSKTYINIINGKFTKKVHEGVAGAVERENKNGKIVHELTYKAIDGRITNAEIVESEYGDNLSLTIDNELTLNLSADSSHARSFFLKMKGIELGYDVRLQTYDFVDDKGKTRKGLTISPLGGEKIPNNWEGVPELITKKKGSKTTYDNTDQINYFYEELKTLDFTSVTPLAKEPVKLEDTTSEDLPF